MNSPLDHLIVFLMFFPIVSLHEAAHAWVAHLLGDDTARDEGRLTLNPAAHIDLWGTVLIPALSLFVFSGMPLGWGRPVPVVGSNFAHWRRDEVLTALAGPAANLLVATAALGIGTLLGANSTWLPLCATFAEVAVFLGVINFIPLPPFDGWTLMRTLFDVPHDWIDRAGLWVQLAIVAVFMFSPLFSLLRLASHIIVFFLAHLLGTPLA